jgi:hypothetical protein
VEEDVMTDNPQPKPAPDVTALRPGSPQAGKPPDTAEIVRRFNALNKAHRQLWLRLMQAADIAERAQLAVRAADVAADDAEAAHLAVQAEHPDRTAPRARQLVLAACTIALDGVACNFAAQALGDSQLETMLWTLYFLVVLAGGEIGLDLYRDHRSAWRLLAGGLSAFVATLGVLRYSFLITVDAEGRLAAFAGAALFTAVTGGLVVTGYRLLRAAETAACWKARHRLRARSNNAARARQEAVTRIVRRDRLVDAYLSVLRASLIESCTAAQLAATVQAVRAHLSGRPQLRQVQP